VISLFGEISSFFKSNQDYLLASSISNSTTSCGFALGSFLTAAILRYSSNGFTNKGYFNRSNGIFST